MSGTRAPKTIVVYDITGQTDYTIPFEYLARKFVVVTLIGQDRKVLTLNTDYRFTTKTTIGLSDTNPVGYDRVEIRRFTSATDRLVDFHDGSILRAYDLNLSQIQTLHVAEEARDLAGDSIAVDDNGDLNARGRKIVNLGDAENDGDAVNLGQLKDFDNSTFNNAQLAKASASAAKVSENKAKASETRAVIAETRAVASAGTAVQAAMDANASKEAAEDSETNAKISETNAKISETNAKNSELKAEQEAAKLQSYNDIALALEPITVDSVHFNRDLEVTNIVDGTKIKVTQIKADVSDLTNRVETNEADVTDLTSRVTLLEQAEVKRGIHTLWSGSLNIEESSRVNLSDSILNYDIIVVETTLYESNAPAINDSKMLTPQILRNGHFCLIAMQASSASPLNDSRAYIKPDAAMTNSMVFSRDGIRQPVRLNAIKGIKY